MVDASTLLLSLLLGSLYTMMALGLTMTYSVTKVPNFAHAEFVTVGAYAAYAVARSVGPTPAGAVGSLAAAFALSAMIALASDELVFRPLFRRGATPLHLLVASIGVGLVIRYSLLIVAKEYQVLDVKSPIVEVTVLRIDGVGVTNLFLWVLPTAMGMVVVLHLLFTRTRLGKAMRAMASNFDLARASGIRTRTVRRVTWLLAGGLAGIAGAFWSIYIPINPETGWLALLWIFAAAILGGFVSFWGTIAGGYVVGFAENTGIVALHDAFDVDLAYRPLIALAIIIAVFLIRPKGLAGVTIAGVVGRLKWLWRKIKSVPDRLRAIARRA